MLAATTRPRTQQVGDAGDDVRGMVVWLAAAGVGNNAAANIAHAAHKCVRVFV